MTQKTNAAGIELVKSFEGCRLSAYLCPAGKWTVGYGHTGPDVSEGTRVTKSRADELLRRDLKTAELIVGKYVKVPLGANQFSALVSFAFNVGEGNFRSSTLLKRVNAGRYNEVSRQLERWVYVTVDGKKQRSRGLARRRAAESALWEQQASETDAMERVSIPPSPREGKSPFKSRTVWGAAIAGAGTVVQGAAEQLEGYAGLPQPVFWVLTGITLAALAFTVYGRMRVIWEEGV